MTKFKCDTRNYRNLSYGKKQFVFTVLYRVYNYCWTYQAETSMGVNGGDSNEQER